MKKTAVIVTLVLLAGIFIAINLHPVRLQFFWGQYVEVRLVFLLILVAVVVLAGFYLLRFCIRENRSSHTARKHRPARSLDDDI